MKFRYTVFINLSWFLALQDGPRVKWKKKNALFLPGTPNQDSFISLKGDHKSHFISQYFILSDSAGFEQLLLVIIYFLKIGSGFGQINIKLTDYKAVLFFPSPPLIL